MDRQMKIIEKDKEIDAQLGIQKQWKRSIIDRWKKLETQIVTQKDKQIRERKKDRYSQTKR